MDKHTTCIIMILTLVFATACSVIKPVAVKDSTVVNYHYIDSINYIDSIVEVPVYKEYYRDYAGMLDTLNLETSLASAQAYLDTTNKKLNGKIQNKETTIPYQIKWKTKTVYKDSIVYQKEEVPVPVEITKKVVPKWCWWLLGIFGFEIIGVVLWILKKYYKIFG